VAEEPPRGPDAGPATEIMLDPAQMFDRYRRLDTEARALLTAWLISAETALRADVRWTGEQAPSRHLAFAYRAGGEVMQLELCAPPEGGGESPSCSLVPAGGEAAGLFGPLPPGQAEVYLAGAALDALSLLEHGFPAVAARGAALGPGVLSALATRTILLVTAADREGRERGRRWRAQLARVGCRTTLVELPQELDGRPLPSVHRLLQAQPLGFVFADLIRQLTAVSRDQAAQAPRAPEAHTPDYDLFILRQRTAAPLARTGLAAVDDLLRGGLDRGLYLLAGGPGTGKSALLEQMALLAATYERAVLLCSLQHGPRGTWERLIARLSQIMGPTPVALADLRAGHLEGEDLRALEQTDSTLRLVLAPYLHIVGGLEAVDEGGVAERLTQEIESLRAAYGQSPLLLIDDIPRLMMAAEAGGNEATARLLARLDQELVRLDAPALAAWPDPGPAEAGAEAAPLREAGGEPGAFPWPLTAFGQGLLRLEAAPPQTGSSLLALTLTLPRNPRDGAGPVRLVLDRGTGQLRPA